MLTPSHNPITVHYIYGEVSPVLIHANSNLCNTSPIIHLFPLVFTYKAEILTIKNSNLNT